MKFFRHSAISLLVSAAVLGLASCGGGDETTTTSQTKLMVNTRGQSYVSIDSSLSTLGAAPAGAVDNWSTPASLSAGINLVAQLDSSGPDAWDASAHPLVYISAQGDTYGSKNPAPGIVIIDGNSHVPVASAIFRMPGVLDGAYSEPMGAAVSPDGKWIYIQSNLPGPQTSNSGSNVLLVINARTLKLDKIIASRMHHMQAMYDANTKKTLMLVHGATSNVYTLDPTNDNRMVGTVLPQNIAGSIFSAWGDPSGQYIFTSVSTGFPDDGTGGVAVLSTADYKVKARIGTQIMTAGMGAFSSDGKTFYTDGRGDRDPLAQIDLSDPNIANWKLSGLGSSGNAMAYGIAFSWDDKRAFIAEKGNSGSVLGDEVSIVNLATMVSPSKYSGSGGAQGVVYLDGCMQPDHLVVHPDPAKNELWAACNSTYDNIVVGMGDTKNVSQNPPDYGRGGAYVKDHIPPLNGGGSHNGAFVKYTVSGSTWTGELLSDLGGFHGSAIQTKADVMAGKIPIGK